MSALIEPQRQLTREPAGEGQTVGCGVGSDKERYGAEHRVTHALTVGEDDVDPTSYRLHREDNCVPVVTGSEHLHLAGGHPFPAFLQRYISDVEGDTYNAVSQRGRSFQVIFNESDLVVGVHHNASSPTRIEVIFAQADAPTGLIQRRSGRSTIEATGSVRGRRQRHSRAQTHLAGLHLGLAETHRRFCAKRRFRLLV